MDIHAISASPDVVVTIDGVTKDDWDDALTKVLFLQPISNYHEVLGGDQEFGGMLSTVSFLY